MTEGKAIRPKSRQSMKETVMTQLDCS